MYVYQLKALSKNENEMHEMTSHNLGNMGTRNQQNVIDKIRSTCIQPT